MLPHAVSRAVPAIRLSNCTIESPLLPVSWEGSTLCATNGLIARRGMTTTATAVLLANEAQLSSPSSRTSVAPAQGGCSCRARTESGFAAAVLAGVKSGVRARREKIFGPARPIVTFADDEEGVAVARRLDYALSATFFTGSLDRARRLRCGPRCPRATAVGQRPPARAVRWLRRLAPEAASPATPTLYELPQDSWIGSRSASATY